MTPRDILALLLIATSVGTLLWQRGEIATANLRAERAQQRADRAEAEASRLDAELQFARVTARVITRYIDRVQIVRERGQAIVKEVPAHVTPQADARCPVPVGFVRVHDAAAQGVPLAGAAGNPDAPAPGLALSGVATVVAGNYTTCHEIREQLIALQGWIGETLQAAGR